LGVSDTTPKTYQSAKAIETLARCVWKNIL